MLTLPRSVRASLWLSTVEDLAAARRAVGAVTHDGESLRLAMVATGTGEPGLLDAMALGRGTGMLHPDALADLFLGLGGAAEHGAILPRPGDPMGAPASHSAELLEAGEGLLVRGRREDPDRCAVLVPAAHVFGSAWEQGVQVTWSVDLDAELPAPALLLSGVSSLSHARRDVQAALTTAVDTLTELDVARERPDLADELLDLSMATVPDHELPPGLDPRRVDVLERAARLLAIVELAGTDAGAAVTSGQAERRQAVLRDVERAARHAMAAACTFRR